MEKQRIQLNFKEFIRAGEDHKKGIGKIKKKSDYVCDLMVYEPKTLEEAQLGNLFILGEIKKIPKKKYRNFDFLLTLLFSVIKREFYSDPKKSTQKALESALNKANLYLTDFTEKGNTEWKNNLTFICGAFNNDEIYLCQTGSAIIKLFRAGLITNIEKKFPKNDQLTPARTFGNIATGSILPGDKMVVGTENILKYIPINSLKQLTENSYQKITEKIGKIIDTQEYNPPILGIVLEGQKVSELTYELSKKYKKPEVSIKKSSKFVSGFLKTIKKIIILIFNVVYKLFKLIWWLISKLFKLISPLFKKIPKPTLPKRVKLFGKLIVYQGKNFYTRLRVNKLAFITAVALVMLLIALPFFTIQKINYNSSLSDFNRISSAIETVQKKIGAALIYQDHKRARILLEKNQELFNEIEKYINDSPIENNQQVIAQANKLKNKHKQQKDSIGNIIRITNLEEILDLSKTGFIIRPSGMVKINENLYFFEMDSGIVYKFKIGTNAKDIVLIFISARDELRNMTLLENKNLVLMGQSEKIYIYNEDTNEHKAYTINPNISIENINSIKSFASNFYILNLNQKSIIKYPLSNIDQEIISGSNWLNDQLKELDDVYDMDIDGSIYVLGPNKIIEYFGGNQINTIPLKLEKLLGNNSKLFIKTGYNNFYISDPENNRLLIVNKKGELINQYYNKSFSDIKDFWISNTEKTGYLLCGKKVYKINF